MSLEPSLPSPYLDAVEAAAYLRTTRGTVYNLVWRGLLPRRKGKLLFTRQELDAVIAARDSPTPRRRVRKTKT